MGFSYSSINLLKESEYDLKEKVGENMANRIVNETMKEIAGDMKKELSELEEFVKSAEKGLEVLNDKREKYADIMKKVNVQMKANAAATELLNKMEEANAIQLVATNGGLTIRETLMGILNGQISIATAATGLWTKAQMGLNVAMNANPIGVITMALGALVTGIGAYKLFTDDASTATDELSLAQEKTIEKSREMQEAYMDMNNARLEAMSKVQAEYGYYEELEDELLSLVDANGKVKEGYEDRANFIVNQFSSVLRMEKEQIWDMIRSNGELGSSLDEVMKKKKAEAILMANEQAYIKAIQEKNAAFSTYQQSLKELDAAEQAYTETKKVGLKYEELLKSGNEAKAEEYRRTHLEEIVSIEEKRKHYDKVKKSVKDNENTYVGYLTTIQNYEGVSAAILSGDAEKIETAMQDLTVSFITAESGTKATLTQQVKDMETFYNDMNEALQNGAPGVTEEMVAQAKTMVERSKEELKIAAEESLPEITEALGNGGIAASQAMIDSFTSKEEELQLKVLEFLGQINSGVALKEEELTILLNTLGINTSDSLINALLGKEASVQAEVIQMLSQLNSGTMLKKEELALLFSNLGITSSDSLINGLAGKKADVQVEAINLLSQLESATSGKRDEIIAELKALGVNVDDGLIKGMESKKWDVGKIAGGLGATIKSNIKKVLGINSPSKETAKLGRFTGEGFVKGIRNYIPEVKKASEDLAQSALQGIDVQKHLAKMRSAMSIEKSMIGANLTSRVVHEFVMGSQSDFVNVGEKIEALQRHIDNIKIQLQLEGKTYIDKREAGYILAPEINKRLGEFAELKGRGNNSR